MGRSPSLLFRIQATSGRQMPRAQFMVSGISPFFQFFADETSSLVKIEPILRIDLQDTSCWTFDWANSEVVAIGCTNGRGAD
jgi:hypothetical protein